MRMRFRGCSTALIATLLSAIVAAPATAVPADRAGLPAGHTAAVAKKKCKAGQTVVLLKKRKRRECLTQTKVKLTGTGTVTDALVSTAFGGTLDRGRSKRGKVGPAKALRRLGPRAEKALARMLPNTIDAFALTAARTRNPQASLSANARPPLARASGTGGATVNANATSGTFAVPEYGVKGSYEASAGSGGSTINGSATVEITGKTAQDIFGSDKATINGRIKLVEAKGSPLGYDIKELTLELDVDGIHVEITITTKIRAKGDDCPTSDGEAKETISVEAGLTFAVGLTKPRINLATGSVFITFDGESVGQTADDAKLDTVKAKLQGTLEMKGSTALGSVSEDVTIERAITVDMRTGGQTQGTGQTTLNVNSSGLLGLVAGKPTPQTLAATLKSYEKQAQEITKSSLDGTVKRFREREEKWLEPETCAHLTWDPPTRSRKVTLGDTGTIKGTIKAVRDGKQPKGMWSRTGQRGGTYTPEKTTSAAGATADITWRTETDSGDMTGTYVVTSKAGVGGATWAAEVESPFRYYKILGAQMTDNENGHSQSNAYSGTKEATFTIGEQAYNSRNSLYPNGRNGERAGQVWTTASSTTHNTMRVPRSPSGSCDLEDTFTEPDPVQIGFDIAIGPTGSTTATLTWRTRALGISVSQWPPDCIVQPIGAPTPNGWAKSEVPVATLEAKTPQTVTFTGSLADVPGYAADGPAVMNLTNLQLSLTFVQVKADGSPL
jgi:hypothetical protein